MGTKNGDGGSGTTAGHDPQADQDALDAALHAEEQGLLFDDDVSPLPHDLGYRGPTACNAAGITYRQLDYWARTGLVEPTVRGATGSGTQRLYGFRDILLLKVIKRLLDAGISLQQIRQAVAHLRARGTDDLTRVTLMSDGASVYECTSDDAGHRPAPGWSGRLRHRHRRCLARDRGVAGRPALRAHGRRRGRRGERRARRPSQGTSHRLSLTMWDGC